MLLLCSCITFGTKILRSLLSTTATVTTLHTLGGAIRDGSARDRSSSANEQVPARWSTGEETCPEGNMCGGSAEKRLDYSQPARRGLSSGRRTTLKSTLHVPTQGKKLHNNCTRTLRLEINFKIS